MAKVYLQNNTFFVHIFIELFGNIVCCEESPNNCPNISGHIFDELLYIQPFIMYTHVHSYVLSRYVHKSS